MSRRKPEDAHLAWAPFDLADPAPKIPADTCAVIHLAADVGFALTAQQELESLRGLVAAAKVADAVLVLVSSQSAKNPRGEYGERKAAAESVVREAGGVIVRPGLVIGGRRPKGLAAQLISLSYMPLLPDIGRRAQVQTIHVEDLAQALVVVARGAGGRTLELAGSVMTLRQLISTMARRLRSGAPMFLPVPLAITRLVAGNAMRGPRSSLRQMLDLQVMRDSMAELGLNHMEPSLAALRSNRPLRRALLIEGRALLVAAGLRRPPGSMLRRYVRIIERDALPRPVNLEPLHRLGSAAVAARRDRIDLDELRRRQTLAVTLFDCSPQGAAATMRFERKSWLVTVMTLGLLGPAVIGDILRTRLVPRAPRR
jgi:hypothetical protein